MQDVPEQKEASEEVSNMSCAQCGRDTEGCKATFLGTPMCPRCEAAMVVIDRVLKKVTLEELCKPITTPISSEDLAVAMLDPETAKRYHDEAVRRALKWEEENFPRGEEDVAPPEELQWAEEVWG